MSNVDSPVVGAVWALGLLLAACGNSNAPPVPSASPTTATSFPAPGPSSSGGVGAATTSIDVKEGKQTVHLTKALVFRTDPATRLLVATSGTLDCTADAHKLPPKGALLVALHDGLTPDGRIVFNPGYAFFDYGGGGKMDVRLDGGKVTSGHMDLSVTYKEESGGFTASGTFVAEDCGEAKVPPATNDTSQPGLTWRVAGKTFPVKGAIVRVGPKETEVVFSGAPLDCDPDESLTYLKLTAKLDHGKLSDFRLEGSALTDDAQADAGKSSPMKLGETGDLESAMAWNLDLPTSREPQKSYHVELEGNAKLKRCTERP